jgi:hypothetical protein
MSDETGMRETEITDGEQGNKMTLPEKHQQEL